jgi:proline iminopeptidase
VTMMAVATGGHPRVREGYFPVPGARLFFREIGDGEALVVVHGGPDFNHNYLLPEFDRLASAFRLIYYDQRGRGKSSQGVTPETVSITSEIDDLCRLRQHFGLETFSIVGHSWGALLAMEYASRHSDCLRRLILLNTAPASHADLLRFRQQRETTDPQALATIRTIAATCEYAKGDVETDVAYYRAHFGKTVGSDQLESVVNRLRSHFTPPDIIKARAIEDRLYAQSWLSPDYDVLARLDNVQVPTLIIHGDRDFVPRECARNVAEAMSHSRLVVLAQCGHFCYIDRPAEVLAAIVDFMSSAQ